MNQEQIEAEHRTMNTPQTSTLTLTTTLFTLSRDMESAGSTANAALAQASDRMAKLHRMVNKAYPIIKAQHGAEHMLDGFKRKKRDIDDLLAEFESELITGATA